MHRMCVCARLHVYVCACCAYFGLKLVRLKAFIVHPPRFRSMELGNEGGATGHADADPSQENPAGAAKHALVHVLLRPADLPALQSQNRHNRQPLHDEARSWLNWLTRQDPDMTRGGLGIDLTDLWPNWRAYIAMHKMAQILVGPGSLPSLANSLKARATPTARA